MQEARNRLFIGHYVGQPESWFLAWGETLEDAALYVDCERAEPDMDSMREVTGPGMIEFTAKLVSEAEAEPEAVGTDLGADDDLIGPFPEFEASGHVSLGEGEGIEENAAWIAQRLADPLGEPNEPTEFPKLGITQKRLADAYRDAVDPE